MSPTDQGRVARQINRLLSQNPFPPSSEAWHAWKAAWILEDERAVQW